MAKEYGLETRGMYDNNLVVADDVSDFPITKTFILIDGKVFIELRDGLAMHVGGCKPFVPSILKDIVVTKKREPKLDSKKPFFVKSGGEYHLYLPTSEDNYAQVECSNNIKNDAVVEVAILKDYGLMYLVRYASLDSHLGVYGVRKEFREIWENTRLYNMDDCSYAIEVAKSWEKKIREAQDKRSEFIENEMPKLEKARKAILDFIKNEFKGVGAYEL